MDSEFLSWSYVSWQTKRPAMAWTAEGFPEKCIAFHNQKLEM